MHKQLTFIIKLFKLKKFIPLHYLVLYVWEVLVSKKLLYDACSNATFYKTLFLFIRARLMPKTLYPLRKGAKWFQYPKYLRMYPHSERYRKKGKF